MVSAEIKQEINLCIHSGSQNCACTKHTYMAYSIESTLQYDRSTLRTDKSLYNSGELDWNDRLKNNRVPVVIIAIYDVSPSIIEIIQN